MSVRYRIVSPRVGTPGDTFDPPPGCNVRALLKARHIIAVPAPKKAGKARKKASS